MTLKEYYDKLPERVVKAPKTEFIKELADMCRVKTITVRHWLYQRRTPDQLKKELISDKLGIKIEDLFPKNEIR